MKKFEKLKNFKNNVVKRTKEVAVNAGCRLDDWAHNTMVCTGYGAGAGAILGGATVIANNFLNVAISSSPLATFAFCTAVSTAQTGTAPTTRIGAFIFTCLKSRPSSIEETPKQSTPEANIV